MKSWKTIVCLMSLVFFVLAGTACQQSGTPGSEELRGSIQKDEASGALVLTASGKTYQVESQQDLAALIGKFVKVEGVISEKGGKQTIAVSSVKE